MNVWVDAAPRPATCPPRGAVPAVDQVRPPSCESRSVLVEDPAPGSPAQTATTSLSPAAARAARLPTLQGSPRLSRPPAARARMVPSGVAVNPTLPCRLIPALVTTASGPTGLKSSVATGAA